MANNKNDLSKFAGIKPKGLLTKPADASAAQSVAAQQTPKKKPAQIAPWSREGIDANKTVSVIIRVSEVEHEMLKFIRSRSGVSTNHTIKSIVMPELEKRAKQLLKNSDAD